MILALAIAAMISGPATMPTWIGTYAVSSKYGKSEGPSVLLFSDHHWECYGGTKVRSGYDESPDFYVWVALCKLPALAEKFNKSRVNAILVFRDGDAVPEKYLSVTPRDGRKQSFRHGQVIFRLPVTVWWDNQRLVMKNRVCEDQGENAAPILISQAKDAEISFSHDIVFLDCNGKYRGRILKSEKREFLDFSH